jgi:hypothetical protein
VLVSGVWNHLRSMVTGRYRISPEAASADTTGPASAGSSPSTEQAHEKE